MTTNQIEEPSHREQAAHIRAKPRRAIAGPEVPQRSAQDVDERARARAVVTALEHLQQAMDALELAARKYPNTPRHLRPLNLAAMVGRDGLVPGTLPVGPEATDRGHKP